MVVYTDNIFLYSAVEKLVEEYTRHHRAYRGKPWRIDIYSGMVMIGDVDEPKACLALRRLGNGRLTATGRNEKSKNIDELGPVDYLNIIRPGEDMSAAVRRVCV